MRDETGQILFSFHVIKYLLRLHMSPTDRHSGLKDHYRLSDRDTFLLALTVFIRDWATLH